VKSLPQIDEVLPLLEQGYTQAEVAKQLGMWQGNLSALLLRHGLRNARPRRRRMRFIQPTSAITAEVRLIHDGRESIYRNVTPEQLRKLADLLDA